MMEVLQHRRLEQLFEEALDLDAHERARFLDLTCGNDIRLRRQVEALLAADGQPARGVLDRPPRLAPLESHPESPADAPVPWLRAGACIAQYELIRELGRGGMATVYLARDTRLGRRVAVKLLHGNQPERTERFILEARATARCSHENIVVIHDVDEHRGMPFLVLEYLKGHPLARLLGHEPMPPSRAVLLAIPVVRALVCAHAHGIVHRDLKPENIFHTDSGTIKVLDFGIAKLVQARPYPVERATHHHDTTLLHDTVHTRRGALVGTLPYMSPEQWNGGEVDARTDVWAVGILLYRMITGQHPLAPLAGEELAVVRVLDQPMPRARDARVGMPPALAEIIDRCLRKRREERMPGAAALLEALEALSPGHAGRVLRADESPYTGLAHFQEADAHRFFGRSRDVAAVLAWLHTRPLVGIAGPSGVGKSSFVRAGIVPALKHAGEDWEALVIRPGRQPMAALASMLVSLIGDEASTLRAERASQDPVLARLYTEPGYLGATLRARARARGSKILVFVDQFEELYTLTRDPRERAAFTACLTGMGDDAGAPLRVILAVRVDFLHRVAEDRGFMAELDQGLYFLTQPDRDGLGEALTRPAEMVGYRFESRTMVEHMLDALETTPGALPLLQFAATRLWDARDRARRLLTERSYDVIGGMDGALAGHADAVLTALAPQDQALVRTMFLHLVTPERTRAIALVSELRELSPDADAVQRVLDHLVDARLLVIQAGDGDQDAEATVEIVHESLIHRWPMLDHWLDESQEDVAFLEQLRTTARQWHLKGRAAGLLWRGEAMRDAARWHRRYRGVLPALQREYLHAVFALAARSARIKRLLVAGSMSALILLVMAAGVALVWIRDAEQEARAAERTVRAQLAVIQAEERARTEAEAAAARARAAADQASTQVELGREELRKVNEDLRVALVAAQRAQAQAVEESARARQESARAQQEGERARHAAEAARRARDEQQRLNARLQELNAALQRHLAREQAQLAAERARVQELERQFGKLGEELK